MNSSIPAVDAIRGGRTGTMGCAQREWRTGRVFRQRTITIIVDPDLLAGAGLQIDYTLHREHDAVLKVLAARQ